jgi:mRNA interferase YafQ
VKPIVQTSQFKQDLKKVKYAGRYAIDDLLVIVDLLARNQPLPEKHREHNLGGNWKGYKDAI